MKRSHSQQHISITKSKSLSPIQLFERHLKSKIQSSIKVYRKQTDNKIKKYSKKSIERIYAPSYCTSPNSYQNSEIISKKQSREKIKLTKKKKYQPKIRNFVKKDIKNEQKLSQSTKQNISSLQKNKSATKNKVKHRNQINKSLQYKNKKNINWQNNLIQKSLQTPILQSFSIKKCYQIHNLISQLRSIEQESSTSSKNFLKYAFNHQNTSKICILSGKARIAIIDWIFLISASLLIHRQTVHLAVHYMDGYLKQIGQICDQMHIVAATALLLSVKQQERQKQVDVLQAICCSQKVVIRKQQLLQKQQDILIKLNFRLKSNTIAFWMDYFSIKWDKYIQNRKQNLSLREDFVILLRSSQGQNYRLYRELTELCDILLFFSEYTNFHKAKLALSVIYLIVRISLQSNSINNKENLNQNQKVQNVNQDKELKKSQNMFQIFKKLFMQKATPIFTDPLNFNQLFNCYLTELCQFELTQIIPTIKFISNFLDLKFSYHIDEKSFQESESYQQFIRKMTYSILMKDYAQLLIIR